MVAEALVCVLFLIVGGVLVLAPVSDYRVGVVGILMIAGGLALMVWNAVQGSRHRVSKGIPPGQAGAPRVGDQR